MVIFHSYVSLPEGKYPVPSSSQNWFQTKFVGVLFGINGFRMVSRGSCYQSKDQGPLVPQQLIKSQSCPSLRKDTPWWAVFDLMDVRAIDFKGVALA